MHGSSNADGMLWQHFSEMPRSRGSAPMVGHRRFCARGSRGLQAHGQPQTNPMRTSNARQAIAPHRSSKSWPHTDGESAGQASAGRLSFSWASLSWAPVLQVGKPQPRVSRAMMASCCSYIQSRWRRAQPGVVHVGPKPTRWSANQVSTAVDIRRSG